MSETGFEEAGGGGPEQPSPDEFQEGYDVGQEGGEIDPFSENFGADLGQTVNDAVQQGINSALGLPPQAPAAEPFPAEAPIELSDEELAAADEGIDTTFDSLEAELGGFDRQQAFAEAVEAFSDLISQGAEPTVATAEEALAIGAQEAAAEARGAPLVERLVAAELSRVPGVDPEQVLALA